MINLTKIYFVRHCEATGNLNRTFQGSTNTDITDLGAKQLEKLSERFKEISLDKIYSSPLLRAYKTAQAIQGGREIELEVHNGLTELDGGVIENKPFELTFTQNPTLKEIWLNHPQDFAPEGGEPMRVAYDRIYNTFWDIVNKSKGKTVACATHGGIMRCLFCRLIHDDISKLVTIPIFDNTAIGLIEISDDFTVEIKFLNDHTHLPDELLRKSSRPSIYTMGDKK